MTGQVLREQEITAFLIAEFRRIEAARLPPEVLEMARHCVLDWLGVTIAGAGEPRSVYGTCFELSGSRSCATCCARNPYSTGDSALFLIN